MNMKKNTKTSVFLSMFFVLYLTSFLLISTFYGSWVYPNFGLSQNEHGEVVIMKKKIGAYWDPFGGLDAPDKFIMVCRAMYFLPSLICERAVRK